MKKVKLMKCNIDDEGCEYFAEGMEATKEENTTLTHLGLNNNQIGDMGVEHLSKVLPDLPKGLRKLDLKYNDSISENAKLKFKEQWKEDGRKENECYSFSHFRDPSRTGNRVAARCSQKSYYLRLFYL